jgi:DNA polymerase (family 10)
MADERRLINQAWREATELTSSLSAVNGVEKALMGGEVRRRCETVGSLAIVVVAADEAPVAHALSDLLSRVERESPGRICGVTEGGLPVKVAVVSAAEAAAAILWSTGSDDHLHALAEHALSAGLRLNESGLWRGDGRVECADEHALYEALGCQWVAPELREGEGEVASAVAGTLPELVDLEDLLGVLHNHTTDSDGAATLEEMAAAARGLGWSFFGVADHSPAASYANGLSAERLRDQWRRIDELNASMPGFRIVRGIEADILTDGSLDIPEGCEEGLEYVVASVHSAFRLTEEAQTERLVRAVSHPACRILGHPTGRLLLARPGYALDLDTVLSACAEHGVAVEINSSPYRLDIDWRWARRALDLGLKLAVNPDAHSTQGLEDVRWGVAVARKAGAAKADLINCSDIDDFLNSR